MHLFDFLITLFESLALYGGHNGLGDHLRGLDTLCTDFTERSIYNIVFIYFFFFHQYDPCSELLLRPV